MPDGAGSGVKTSGMAVIALVLGAISLVIGPLGLVALIVGIIALVKINGDRALKGGVLAIVGLVLGGVGLLLGCVLLGILLPAVSKAREVARLQMAQSQLRVIAQSLGEYQRFEGHYPFDADTWSEPLIENGLISADMLISPGSDGDGVEYVFFPDYPGVPTSASLVHPEILIYEDPDHFKDFVLVGLTDGTVVAMDKPEFFERLGEQEGRGRTEPSP